MGVGRLNIWVSDVADPCGIWSGGGKMTIFDCKEVFHWPCGRYMDPKGNWEPVPNGVYKNIPFICGHLQVELPPGCYWVIAAQSVTPGHGYIHLNYTTHVGIAQVRCDETTCVKIYNPSIKLCWNWFWVGAKILAAEGKLDAKVVGQIEEIVENRLLKEIPALPAEEMIRREFEELIRTYPHPKEKAAK